MLLRRRCSLLLTVDRVDKDCQICRIDNMITSIQEEERLDDIDDEHVHIIII